MEKEPNSTRVAFSMGSYLFVSYFIAIVLVVVVVTLTHLAVLKVDSWLCSQRLLLVVFIGLCVMLEIEPGLTTDKASPLPPIISLYLMNESITSSLHHGSLWMNSRESNQKFTFQEEGLQNSIVKYVRENQKPTNFSFLEDFQCEDLSLWVTEHDLYS